MIKFFTVTEIATVLRVSKQQVRRMIQSGELLAVKVGREYRIPEESIIDFVATQL